jgi:hypothetical protein
MRLKYGLCHPVYWFTASPLAGWGAVRAELVSTSRDLVPTHCGARPIPVGAIGRITHLSFGIPKATGGQR